MRCPKCGYISFDHINACLKCNKEIANASSHEGTTYNVAPPSFLKFTKRAIEETVVEDDEIAFDTGEDDFGVVDPDLDVLVDNGDDESGVSFDDDIDDFGGFGEEEDFEVATMDSDDDEGGIDLGQFEEAFEEEEQDSIEGGMNIEIPDELSDISDLSAPADEDAAPAVASASDDFEPAVALESDDFEEDSSPAVAEDSDEFEDFNLDLDMENLNDDFSLTEEDEGEAEVMEEDALGDLSLDDLGLSDDEQAKKPERQAAKATKKGEMDMDADLDFDLDLGGISLDDDDE